jgi:uncharacterized protein (TIGR02145 family)
MKKNLPNSSKGRKFSTPTIISLLLLSAFCRLPLSLSAQTPVTNVTNVPTQIYAKTPFVLSGLTVPNDATNQEIVWSISNDGGTDAAISGSGYTLTANNKGTVTVTATITGGGASGDYTRNFDIEVMHRGLSICNVCLPVGPIMLPIASLNKNVGDPSTTLHATATGAFAYQWFVNGVAQPWTTIPEFEFATPTSTGTYTITVVAISSCGAAPQTGAVTVEVCDLVQGGSLTSVNICPGKHAFPALVAPTGGGTGAIAYLWQQSIDGENWTNADGANNTQNYTTPILPRDTIMYYRRQANRDCGPVYSNVATVTVDPIRPVPQFMAYNLGAVDTLDTPKKQMKYLAGVTSSNTDSTVYGALYQWGRSGKGADNGYQVRPTTVISYPTAGYNNIAVNFGTITYDAVTGQPSSAAHMGRIVYSSISAYDWRVPTSSSGTQCTSGSQCDTLWGNGKDIATATPGGGWPGIGANSGNTYQMPYKTINDPCPNGYRVPTQDDWERLGNYCNPAAGAESSSPLTGSWETTTGFTWVSVRCGAAVDNKCIASRQTWSTSSPGGFAIYHTDEWNASGLTNNSDLLAAGTPEPLLFLPAAGYRGYSTGSYDHVGAGGYYWSSTVNGTYPYYLSFGNIIVSQNYSAPRAYAFSVRCVAED